MVQFTQKKYCKFSKILLAMILWAKNFYYQLKLLLAGVLLLLYLPGFNTGFYLVTVKTEKAFIEVIN